MVLGVGCGGRVDPGGDQGGTTSTSSAGTTGTTMGAGGSGTTTGAGGSGTTTGAGGSGTPEPPPRPPGDLVCPAHEPLNSHVFANLEEKRLALVGWWIQCSKQG